MYLKRFLSLLIALMLICGFTCVQAEALSDLTIEYIGGVVFRSIPRDNPNAELINIAYVDTTSAYCIVDVPCDYSIVLSGGVAPYTVEVLAVWQELDDTSLSYSGYAEPTVDDDYTFTITYDKHARYFLHITVTDAEGQSLVFQTRPFEAFPPSAENDATTVAGKVNQIIDEYITPSMSDYTRAKVLHDWLIFNANYDYTYTNRGADGVLLKGTGVCDSYARAYQLLLTAAGVESTIVTGFGNGDSHAWNLVKLGGSWYHVDCTWDDPNEGGGYERWDYFCLTDEQLGKDHDWNRENTDPIIDTNGMISPEATDTTYAQSEASVDYDFGFTQVSELTPGFTSVVYPARKGRLVAKYLGSDISSIYGSFGTWVNELNSQYGETDEFWCTQYGYFTHNGIYYLYTDIDWTDPLPYLRIDETNIRASIGDTIELLIAEQADDMTGVTWKSSDPAVATVSNGVVTCLTGGTADIAAVYNGNVLDTVKITVLEAHAPEFDLTLTETAAGVTLTWNSIYGVTEYRIIKTIDGVASTIATVTGTSASLTNSQLSSTVLQEVYVQGVRVVGGTDRLSYESAHLSYGRVTIHYLSVLPADTVTISDAAFLNNTSLTTMKLQSGVKTIGDSAFKGCTKMTAVYIPASVTSIAASAFDGCTALKYAEVPAGSYAETWFTQNLPHVTLID